MWTRGQTLISLPHLTEQKENRHEWGLCSKFAMLSAIISTLLASHLFFNPPVAYASVSDCSGNPSSPIYPGYDSSESLALVNNSKAGSILIRQGFYCVPEYVGGGQTPPLWEYNEGFGFGIDKVQNRHYVGRPQDGWSKSDAIKAAAFVLTADSSRTWSKSDEWGFGWNFEVTAQRGMECPEGATEVSDCNVIQQMDVRAASTEGGDDYEPRGGMPAGEPLGLQTVYCLMNPPTELRCPPWVTNAMVAGAGKLNIQNP